MYQQGTPLGKESFADFVFNDSNCCSLSPPKLVDYHFVYNDYESKSLLPKFDLGSVPQIAKGSSALISSGSLIKIKIVPQPNPFVASLESVEKKSGSTRTKSTPIPRREIM